MTPVIGITTYGRDENGRFFLPGQYIDAVRRAGAIPILLPPGEVQVESWLDLVDGLILTGGGDIHPDFYGGGQHESLYMMDLERDRSDLALARAAASTGKPTLGICRGLQSLNVALGGTLIQHLPEEVGEQVAHRLPPRQPVPHAVRIVSESALARALGCTATQVVSWHHQAVRRLAPSLKATAWAPDEIIEAVEMESHPWLIAVQWHPELSAAQDPVQQGLFDRLVLAAAQLKVNRSR
ncbi:MAG: gamma-glutamyl-gamma-aminobutyrate hydrolase family protein [Acidobacteriota bacterium]